MVDSKSADPRKSRFAWRHPLAYLGVHGVVGLLLSAACAWVFFSIAEDIPEQGTMIRVDHAVTAWLQLHGTERGEAIFLAVSYLGAQMLSALTLLAGITLIVRRDWRHLAVLAVTCGGGFLLNGALKETFQRARPDVGAEFHARSWSFPSAHAMDSLIVYGLFAYWLARRFPHARRAIYAGAGALVLLIGYARIYLGVHYLSDVIAGFSVGFLWLSVCITGYEFAEKRHVGASGQDEAHAPSR